RPPGRASQPRPDKEAKSSEIQAPLHVGAAALPYPPAVASIPANYYMRLSGRIRLFPVEIGGRDAAGRGHQLPLVQCLAPGVAPVAELEAAGGPRRGPAAAPVPCVGRCTVTTAYPGTDRRMVRRQGDDHQVFTDEHD